MKKDILVPFDGSKNAAEALRLAISMAKLLQEKIIVLNVQPSFHLIHTKLFFEESMIRDYQKQLFHETTVTAKTMLEDSGIEFELKLKIGDIKEQICQEAMNGIRMIIMGSRGMNPLLGGLLGSVSYGVLNSAPCPVTIVPLSSNE